MKRIVCAVLALCLILALADCGFANAAADNAPTAGTETEEAEVKEEAPAAETMSADEAIRDVKAIGFIDSDGAKLKAIAVEYGVELKGDSVSVEDFEIDDYSIRRGAGALQVGAALGTEPGIALRAYVNDAPEMAENGKDTGHYVIIEVNTDYLMSSVPRYTMSLIAGVKQVGEIESDSAVITAGTDFVRNFEETESGASSASGEASGASSFGNITLDPDGYVLDDIAGYQLFYKSSDERYDPEHPAFLAEHCFEEATGEYTDVELPYALYVPADYDPAQKYALVLHILDAGALGSDPMIILTEGQAPANYASDEVQQLIKDRGLAGIIVVAPQIEFSIRTTRDNWTISAGVAATWQLMDALTEQYSIDMDYIFGTGQSMGGMQVMAMAGQRDNYFAGMWLQGMQWGNNYNKEVEYNGAPYYNSEDPTIRTTDDDGNDSDYGRNWYYLISDDNVLFTNCLGDNFSTSVWREMNALFQDIAGVEIPRTEFNPLELTVEEQNAKLEELLAVDSGRINFHWQSFNGGSHMMTWVYGQRLDAGYKWLLSQSRQAEHDRAKLAELNRPWSAETDAAKIAGKQTEDRFIGTLDGEDIYFAVPAEGAGTIGYNTTIYGMGGGSIMKVPGWTE